MDRLTSISLLIILLLSGAAHGQLIGNKRTQHPNYSPDGKLFVYSSTLTKGSDDLAKGIAVMNVDGTQVRTVTPITEGVFDEFPTVSRDGNRIAFLRRTAGPGKASYDIFVVNVDGSGLTQLTKTPERELRPEFNHDDSAVIFVRDYSTNVSSRYGSLHSVDIATKKEHQILGKEYQVAHAVAAPRGLFFVAIAKLDTAGKPLDVIRNGNTITLVSPTGELSPDSPIRFAGENSFVSRIQFVMKGKEFMMYAQAGGWFGKAYVITPKGTEVFEESDFSLSPDGAKLVKWGGGSSVYVKDLRAERGIEVGEK